MENVSPLLIFIFQNLSNDLLEFNSDHIFEPKKLGLSRDYNYQNANWDYFKFLSLCSFMLVKVHLSFGTLS
jgi:hypothetical protein